MGQYAIRKPPRPTAGSLANVLSVHETSRLLTWRRVAQYLSKTTIYFVLRREVHSFEHLRCEYNAALGLDLRQFCAVSAIAIGEVLVVVVVHGGLSTEWLFFDFGMTICFAEVCRRR